MTSGIYEIRTRDGLVYVGSSKQLRQRVACHQRELLGDCHAMRKLQAAFNADQTSVTFEIVETGIVEHQLVERELARMLDHDPLLLLNRRVPKEVARARALHKERTEAEQARALQQALDAARFNLQKIYPPLPERCSPYFTGVRSVQKMWTASFPRMGGRMFIGTHSTPELAFTWRLLMLSIQPDISHAMARVKGLV